MIPAETPATPPESIVFPGGWLHRLWFAWATVAVPVLLFALATLGMRLSSKWQRPDAGIWFELLVDHPAILAFGPLLLVAVLVCAAVALKPGAWVFSWPCRLVLLVGFLLGLQFALLVPGSLFIRSSWQELPGAFSDWGGALLFVLVAYAIPLGAAKAFEALKRRLPTALVIVALGLFFLALLILSAALLPSPGPEVDGNPARGWPLLILGSFLMTLFGGPVWTAGALGHLLWRLRGAQRLPVLGILAALAAFLASWRIAIHQAVEAYQALPPTKPTGCFVATAAAQAPPWLTGSFEAPRAEGGALRVSPQLQRLKLFEIVLQTLAPRGHQALRRIYDRLGPPIAARIDTPARAAVAWLALYPCELAAAGFVRLLAGKSILQRARGFYRSAPPGSGGEAGR